MFLVFLWFSCIADVFGAFRRTNPLKAPRYMPLGSEKLRFDDACDGVCVDLPKNDMEPVCMMFSRYKKGYQYFVNLCHARRAICKENIVLHIVHPSRCSRNNQFFMPVN